mmetsp:Transcript_6080/g.22300  ORF Transcript_6080/g.22300 Transcript_6080/m.22300 type:complete len:412 (+) Transcript_6080:52-1287(+)
MFSLALFALLSALVHVAHSHEYMGFPPCRTGHCQVNGMIMGYRSDNPTHEGTTELQNVGTLFGDGSGEPADPELVKHLFRYNYAYTNYACGGSPIVVNKPLKGTHGTNHLLSNCAHHGIGDQSITFNPKLFDMTVEPPEGETSLPAGEEFEVTLNDFFHQALMRFAICYKEDYTCNEQHHFHDYILGYHFNEGTMGCADAYNNTCVYSAVMKTRLMMPNRAGRAVLQWHTDTEDARSYVSCSDIIVTENPSGKNAHLPPDVSLCNGHPLCNCTIVSKPTYGSVGLGAQCPMGTESPVFNPIVKGKMVERTVGVIEQWKDQLGVEEFCNLCISNGCASTCGGTLYGFPYYQGPSCTNEPVIAGCSTGVPHVSSLPAYIPCTKATCPCSTCIEAQPPSATSEQEQDEPVQQSS